MPAPSPNLINVKALFAYRSSHSTDLPFDPGQEIAVYELVDENWYIGEYPDPTTGLKIHGMFPKSFVRPVLPPRPQTTKKSVLPPPKENIQKRVADAHKAGEKARLRARKRSKAAAPLQPPPGAPRGPKLQQVSKDPPKPQPCGPKLQQVSKDPPKPQPCGPKLQQVSKDPPKPQPCGPKLQQVSKDPPKPQPCGPKLQLPNNPSKPQSPNIPLNAPRGPKNQQPKPTPKPQPRQTPAIFQQHLPHPQPRVDPYADPSHRLFSYQQQEYTPYTPAPPQTFTPVPGAHLLQPQSQHCPDNVFQHQLGHVRSLGEAHRFEVASVRFHPPISIFPVQTARQDVQMGGA